MTPSDRDRPDETDPNETDPNETDPNETDPNETGSADDRLDEPLADRIAELTDVLTDLRSDLESERRTSGRWAGGSSPLPGSDRQPPFRPPNPVELLRFTERYTIPTLIALLETTIRSLELLQASLRLADPDGDLRSASDRSMSGCRGADRTRTGGDRLADVRDGAAAGVTRSLSELRRALSESDLPREATSREILTDARELTAEIEELLVDAEARDRVGNPDRSGRHRSSDSRDDEEPSTRAAGSGRSVQSGPVSIDVTDPTQSGGSDEQSGGSETKSEATMEDSNAHEVDVDAELESIKRSLETDDESESNNEDDEKSNDKNNGKSNNEDDGKSNDKNNEK